MDEVSICMQRVMHRFKQLLALGSMTMATFDLQDNNTLDKVSILMQSTTALNYCSLLDQ